MDNVPSLADIAAVTDKNDGLGGSMGGGFWIFALIILFAMMGNGFGGWGNRGGSPSVRRRGLKRCTRPSFVGRAGSPPVRRRGLKQLHR